MNSSNKKILLLSLVVFIGVTLFFIWDIFISQKETERPEIKIEEVLENGMQFILSQGNRFGVDSLLVTKEINKICKEEELEDFWSNILDEIIYGQEFFYKLFDSEYKYDDISSLKESLVPDYYTTWILLEAAYCDEFPYNSFLNDIQEIERDGGYNSSLILFSLKMVKERDCYDEKLIDPLISELVDELKEAQDEAIRDLDNLCSNYLLLDIYAERAAFVGYAGYPVERAWIENLSYCQKENGSWFDNVHTSSLALWAIAQYNNGCE